MNVQPKVSVLVPAYNVAEVLPRAVRSALEQTMDDIEVLIVDDASTDETFETAGKLAALESRVRTLRAAKNGGPGAARTLGLGAARGDWIAILDADDVFRPDRLARLVHEAEAKNLDAIADNLELVDPGAGAVVAHAFPLADTDAVAITPERFLANSIPAGRINLGWMQPVVRRSFLSSHDIKWRDLRHAEDFVFTMELLMSGARLALLGWPGYAYTQRRGSSSRMVSSHSRTRRSASEQHRALDELLRRRGAEMSTEMRRRLTALRAEITVASHLLDARDHADSRDWLPAAASVLTAAASPLALSSCILARYGPNAGRLR